MSKWELNKKCKDSGVSCQINKKPFVGATSEDLFTHHMMPTLKNNTPDEVIIHAGINDTMQLADKDGGMSSEVMDIIAKNIIKCGQVAKSYGVNRVCISALLPIRGKKYQQTISHINYRIEHLCKREGFDFMTNINIIFTEANPVDEGLHYKDGIHLNAAGRQVLMDNFISYLGMH
jgi:lysophospholipase L1-like esterase